MRKMMQYAFLMVLLFLAAPYLIASIIGSGRLEAAPVEKAAIKSEEIEDGFERYIIGVVAAEMPALYHEEALKAQAVASRTYSINFMERSGSDDFSKIGQAYIDEDEMKRRWGDYFDTYYSKIAQAVLDTSDEIMVYEGEPIVAVFHAFSAGKTENSGDVWQENLPYLKSVNSAFDETAAGFEQEIEFTGNEFITLLREEYPDMVFDKGDIIEQIKIQERTEGGYVKSIIIGNKIMDGATLRRIFGLPSTCFEVYRNMDKIVFWVRGYGHGAGMSQVGANYLAGEGYTYTKILEHYYSDIEFGRIR